MQIRVIACDLLDRGYEVFVAVRSAASAARIFWNERERPGFTLLRTPSSTIDPQRREQQPTVTLADVFFQQGFVEPDLLATVMREWLALLQEIHPDLIVSDFSPLLNLAARGRVPIIVIGNGYMIPPNGGPLPPIAPWVAETPSISTVHELKFVESVNAILCTSNRPLITHMGELFHGDQTFICTFPEFDPYQRFAFRHHRSPFNLPSFPQAAPVSERPNKDVFLYLPGAHPSLAVVAEILSSLDRRAVVFAPGIDGELKTAWAKLGHDVLEAPADLADVLFRVGLVIHHSGLALAHAALLAGVPQLLLPLGLEHAVTALGAQQFGACAALFGETQVSKDSLLGVCTILLTDPDAKDTAYRNSLQVASRLENTKSLILDACLRALSKPN